MTQIFLTGATGYIGGQVLHEIVRSHPGISVTVLVRDQTKADSITKAYPSAKTLVGDLDSTELLEQEASQAHVVLNLANSKHIPAIEAIHRGLQKTTTNGPVYWVQISGATALAAAELISKTFEPGTPSPELFDDVEDIENYRSHIQQHPFRAADNYMLNVTKDNSNIKTAVVLPPVIFGPGEGPVNQRSVQVPGLIRYALQNGKGAQVGKGLNRWGNVHIRDLGRLFGALVDKAAKQDTSDDLWGANGIYFTDVGEMAFGELAQKIAKVAVEQGQISNGAVEELSKEGADQIIDHGWILLGTNARGRPHRATELLKWSPREESLESTIPAAVAEEASRV